MGKELPIAKLGKQPNKGPSKKTIMKWDTKEEEGERLKDFRVKSNMTMEQVADKTGFSVGTISNYENGKTSPNFRDLQTLLFTYGATLYDYFGIKKADYENDYDVFKKYGLSESFYCELFFTKYCRQHDDMVNCLNLIFNTPMYASQLFEDLTRFFNVSLHEQIDLIPINHYLDTSVRILLEPVIHELENIFYAIHPERRRNQFSSLLGNQVSDQLEIQAELFEKAQQH